MVRMLSKVLEILVLPFVATSISAFGILGGPELASAQQPPAFAISPTPPSELNPTGGGAAQATLQQAAEFAWEEFFALNWPAGPSGQITQRDTPSPTCAFGDQSSNCAGALVWETFRGKVEIFPGDFNPPPGYSATAPSYGYDAPPQYNYGTNQDGSPVGPCLGPPPPPTPWVNLDETDQITVDSMFAGVVSVKPSANNSAPQLIRYLAKANRTEYAYIAKHQWWDGSAPVGDTATYVKANKQDPPNGDSYVLLPPNTNEKQNTIEIKAGWRVLDPSKEDSRRFHTATVRYYEKASNGNICYQQATFALVSLHIIQKTPMAPYFIYATFEQADNILDAHGKPAEDVDGARLQAPTPPTTPSVTLNDTDQVNSSYHIPPQVVVPANDGNAEYCAKPPATPSNMLFYLNTNFNPNNPSAPSGLPIGGYICINQRDNGIPPIIIDANTTAHALIQSYSAAHGITNSVWQYYKLVNVQYLPINKDHPGLYGTQTGENDFLHANNPSTYYLANIVVETNRPLQLFSGSLVPGVTSNTTGSNSDYDSQFGGQPGPGIHSNMFYGGNAYNMGGCMGCHGAQGQSRGGDFSVIVVEGPVLSPEVPAPTGITGAAVIERNRSLNVIPRNYGRNRH
ncbi:MAG: hypothetical protein JO212_15600 [Acetobacteraceae bacterium]|nr:hypothetical protein [Acetobacteraceae bacterium]